ncbi:rRNA-processing protein EFG1 [Paramyrothecium foliicola]|nr:rRNA-processing protein EFG1 [Paramyrothecium foliicola]
MGTKRSFNEVDAEGSPAPTRDGSFTARKRRDDGRGKHKAKEGSIEWAKKRARNIERLFSRNQDLPANVRNDLERELAAHKATITDKAFQKRRSAMISKYHMVRFFERKKASRLVKQLRRKLEQASDGADNDALKCELHVAEVDEAYTLYHPHAEPYISLYGASKSEEADDDSEEVQKTSAAQAALKAERPPMWSVVEKTMAEGTDALTKLRERRNPDAAQAAPGPSRRAPRTASAKRNTPATQQSSQPRPAAAPQQGSQQPAGGKQNGTKQKPQLNRRERRRLMRETMATKDDSDEEGGFFEEG